MVSKTSPSLLTTNGKFVPDSFRFWFLVHTTLLGSNFFEGKELETNDNLSTNKNASKLIKSEALSNTAYESSVNYSEAEFQQLFFLSYQSEKSFLLTSVMLGSLIACHFTTLFANFLDVELQNVLHQQIYISLQASITAHCLLQNSKKMVFHLYI